MRLVGLFAWVVLVQCVQAQEKPRVLLLGDSISIGYTPLVSEMLKGEAIVTRPLRANGKPENCQGTTHGVQRIDTWLAKDGGSWDVIHFNFGLHDLKRVDPETGKNSNDPKDPHQADPATYERQLRRIVAKLKETKAKLIFATTTPVPPGGVKPYREVSDPERYNRIARKVMKEHGIAINDLYAFAKPRLQALQQPVNVHFNRAGSKALATQVVKAIRQAFAKTEKQSPPTPRPNLVFFLADDQRADLLGCAGHPILRTPTIDRLAASGVRFRNMFVTTSICAASRASFLTGVVERTHKYTFRTVPIDARLAEQSYPRQLRLAGYQTGFVGKFGVKVANRYQQKMFDDFKPLSPNPYFKPQPDGTHRHLTEITGDHAIAFLRKQTQQTPFCLSVSFNAPHAQDNDKINHYPWPKAMDGLYQDVIVPIPELAEPEVFASQPDFLKNSFNRVRWFWRWDTPQKYQRNVKAYFRMISGVDHVIGRVLSELEQLGLAENTVVIYAADNGYYLGSRGFAGKWSHYEESLRVPLVIYDPRLKPEQRGRVDEHLVLNLDLAPTLLELAGVPVPEVYQGQSLRPLVEGKQHVDWRKDFFAEHLFQIGTKIPKWEGVHDHRYVYARYFEQEPVYEFVHDLERDPQQRRNFASDPAYASILARLRSRCDTLRDQYGGRFHPDRFPLAGSRR